MPLIIAEFHLTPDLVGLIGTSLAFDAVIGPGLGEPMADRTTAPVQETHSV
jgi:hypothetical protein